ncbi:uncharacterized protein LOC130729069 isoform X2 [Lotus japonicus]|uniref:uncharacterized protein LOC130729069 isoform X2 n=1 Tax=Lotus japonicus TaxID=34305 RepID=UPI002583A84F|nr:uncharacterized protein LOC130729069 isoform X2 [Lotus japonicus]
MMAASNGTASNPNCPHASNPYHQCTQACSKKTSHRTKPHAKNTSSSGYQRSATDGEPGSKNTNRTHSGAAPPPSNFDRRKKPGSRPEPPVVAGAVPAAKVEAIQKSNASSPISNHSEIKKVESRNDDHNHSVPVSGQIHVPLPVPDVKHVHEEDQQKNGVEHLANPIQTKQEDKTASDVHPGEGLATTFKGGSIDFSFSGIIPQGNEDNDDKGDTESVVSESRVPVGKYHVKESFASILESILDKYGDIGASCHLESLVLRSYYIECVCFVVQELQSDSIMHLTKSKINELVAILKDVESAQLRVAWLRSALDEIAENVEVINQHQEVDAAKANTDREMESLREQLESEMESLAEKEQEVADIKKRIPEISDRLKELELKSAELEQSMLSSKSEVENLHRKSLIDELL